MSYPDIVLDASGSTDVLRYPTDVLISMIDTGLTELEQNVSDVYDVTPVLSGDNVNITWAQTVGCRVWFTTTQWAPGSTIGQPAVSYDVTALSATNSFPVSQVRAYRWIHVAQAGQNTPSSWAKANPGYTGPQVVTPEPDSTEVLHVAPGQSIRIYPKNKETGVNFNQFVGADASCFSASPSDGSVVFTMPEQDVELKVDYLDRRATKCFAVTCNAGEDFRLLDLVKNNIKRISVVEYRDIVPPNTPSCITEETLDTQGVGAQVSAALSTEFTFQVTTLLGDGIYYLTFTNDIGLTYDTELTPIHRDVKMDQVNEITVYSTWDHAMEPYFYLVHSNKILAGPWYNPLHKDWRTV
jgi:hypothetical protein